MNFARLAPWALIYITIVDISGSHLRNQHPKLEKAFSILELTVIIHLGCSHFPVVADYL